MEGSQGEAKEERKDSSNEISEEEYRVWLDEGRETSGVERVRMRLQAVDDRDRGGGRLVR